MCFPFGYMGGGKVKSLPGRSLAHTGLTHPEQAEGPENTFHRPLGPGVRICHLKGEESTNDSQTWL